MFRIVSNSAVRRVVAAAMVSLSAVAVASVAGADQLAEIVRMLGAGEGDEAAARHARELLAA